MNSILLILLSLSAFALETDNYLVWDRELKDSRSSINQFFNDEMEKILEDSESQSLSCQEITKKIGKVFASHLVHDNPVEKHLLEVLGSDEIYPATLFFVEESIYRDPFRIYIPYFGLAPNIQVNGFYFGTDKLSHFASTGRIYFEKFQKTSSLEKALTWGIQDEKSVHGYWASGVFSFADLEANYQGFLFYQNLCGGKNPYLGRKNQEWVLERKFDIKDYVSGLWDESYLESYRLPGNWEKVRPILQREYCSLKNSPLVRNRFHYYSTHLPGSSSLPYFKGLKLPKAQSFQELCSNRQP